MQRLQVLTFLKASECQKNTSSTSNKIALFIKLLNNKNKLHWKMHLLQYFPIKLRLDNLYTFICKRSKLYDFSGLWDKKHFSRFLFDYSKYLKLKASSSEHSVSNYQKWELIYDFKNVHGFFIHLKVSINGCYSLLSMKFNGEIETPQKMELKNPKFCSYDPPKYITLDIASTE